MRKPLPTHKTPTPRRTSGESFSSALACALAFSALSSAGFARAQDAWTDREVSERARLHAPAALAARGAARRDRARLQGVGLHPNPSVDWERQESFAPNAQAQDLVRLTVPFDLSGRRDAQQRLAELGAEESEAHAARLGRELSARALGLLYVALAAERRAGLLEEAQATLDEAARVLASRQLAGEVSGYERARLTLESELGRGRLARATLEREVVGQELAALLGSDDPARPLAGDFDVPAPAALEVLLETAARQRTELTALEAQRVTAASARSAADTAWIPSFSLLAGYNRQDGPQVGHGYTVGVRVDVPLFDRGQGEQAAADAALSAIDEQADARLASVRAEVSAARARLVGLLAERERFGEATRDATELLLRAANSGFSGGERTLVELLDAQRAALEVAQQRLALDLAVRLADVELRRVTGAP